MCAVVHIFHIFVALYTTYTGNSSLAAIPLKVMLVAPFLYFKMHSGYLVPLLKFNFSILRSRFVSSQFRMFSGGMSSIASLRFSKYLTNSSFCTSANVTLVSADETESPFLSRYNFFELSHSSTSSVQVGFHNKEQVQKTEGKPPVCCGCDILAEHIFFQLGENCLSSNLFMLFSMTG